MGVDKAVIAEAFLRALVLGDASAAIREYCAPAFGFWSAGIGDAAHLLAGMQSRMRSHLDRDGLSFTIHGVTSDGDRVAIEAESQGRLTNGAVYRNQYHFLIMFDGERVSQVREYHDTAGATAIWGKLFAIGDDA